jgi:hypothetical protein
VLARFAVSVLDPNSQRSGPFVGEKAFHRHLSENCCRAVSQLLWPGKDREVWFSWEENHEKAYRFPDFLQRGTSWEK